MSKQSMRVAFTSYGRHIVSISDDGILTIWQWRIGKLICPPLAVDGLAMDLVISADGRRVVCGGWLKDLPVFHLDQWLAPPQLGPDNLCAWTELVSGQRVEEGGGVNNLTAEEWLQRWRDFRSRHPGYPKMEVTEDIRHELDISKRGGTLPEKP